MVEWGRASTAASRYWELTVPTSEQASEALTNFLWEAGAVGVVEEEAPGKLARLRAFFPSVESDASLLSGVSTYLDALRALGIEVHGDARISLLADGDWVEAFRSHFRPIPVGRRFIVAPPWDAPAVPGRLVLVIEPGRAFGTGHHGSTAGCLEAIEGLVEHAHMERRADAPERRADAPERRADAPEMIDLGCGSGILSIAAARLGVERIVAIDTDPDAVSATSENAAKNGVSDRIQAIVADADTAGVPAAPLVVANLLAALHDRLAARYDTLVAPGGALVLGGILDAEAGGVAQTLERHGFTLRRTLTAEGWTTLVLVRTARGGGSNATRHDRA